MIEYMFIDVRGHSLRDSSDLNKKISGVGRERVKQGQLTLGSLDEEPNRALISHVKQRAYA